MPKPSFLMCRPTFFGVDYVINPWMSGHIGDVDRSLAAEQWSALHELLVGRVGADVRLVDPVDGLPDMVFTANAGLVHGRTFVPSRFRHPEMQGEEKWFESWFEESAFHSTCLSGFNEGAGDALFIGDRLFAAWGFRTDREVHGRLSARLGVQVSSLELVNPSFYHLDTCFCPLPGGYLLWHPAAFSPDAIQEIRSRVPAEYRYEVNHEDAAAFACNAVGVEGHVILNKCGAEMADWIASKGFTLHLTPLGEFMKAGGSAKCLTLRLDVAAA